MARTEILSVLLQPWLQRSRLRKKTLLQSLRTLDLTHSTKKIINDYIDDYLFLGGQLFWNERDIPKLQECLKQVLNITNSQLVNIISNESADSLKNIVKLRTISFNEQEINEICNVLTKVTNYEYD